MDMKKGIKRMAALGGSGLMTFATVAGAMAANLGDYPAPFVTNGEFDGKIVIGAGAQTADVIGAIDIAASLQAAAKTPAGVVSGGGTVSVSGGKVEDIPLGTALNDSTDAFGNELDYNDVSVLQKTQINIDIDGTDDDYDVEDHILFNSGVSVETGLTVSSPKDDFKDDILMPIAKDAIKYEYSFEDALNAGNMLNDSDSDNEITIDFLGRTLKISGATNTSLTVTVGQEIFMNIGDSVEVEGKTVTLDNVGSGGNVQVTVDGESKVVDATGNTKVGGLRVAVDNYFYEDNVEGRAATLIIGEQTTKTYDNNDEFIGEDEDDPDWVWEIADGNGASPVLRVSWDQSIDSPSDDYAVIGDCFEMPFGFAKICLDSVNQNSYQEYTVTGMSYEELYPATGNTELNIVGSPGLLEWSTSSGGEDGFLAGGEDTDSIVAWFNATDNDLYMFYYDNTDNKYRYFAKVDNTTVEDTDVFSIQYDDSLIGVDVTLAGDAGAAGGINWTLDETGQIIASSDDGKDLIFNTEITSSDEFDWVGLDEDQGVASSICYGGAVTPCNTSIGAWEENTRTDGGLILLDPDANAPSDFKFQVPTDITDFKVNVVVAPGTSTVTTSSSSSSSSAYMVNSLPVGIAIFDTEAGSRLGSDNLIVVGGPCANTVAHTLMGSPSPCGVDFEAGKAKIKWYDGESALLVAGYEGPDTIAAARVLAQYDDHASDFAGQTEVEVTTATMRVTTLG